MSSHEASGVAPDVTNEGVADAGTDLARLLADIARVLLAPRGATTAAERILSLAVDTMDGCDEAGLCSDSLADVRTVSSAVMAELDCLQTRLDQGPCRDTFAGRDSVYVPDLLDDDTWPQFSAEAACLGLRSALAYRLSLDGQTLGALQLYSRLPSAFNAHERAQGLVFAIYAGLALTQAAAQATDESRIENLQSALASRTVIGQAQGILMERERITADQAFVLLRRSSQHLNRKLRAVAQDIVDTGSIPPESTGV